MRKLWDSGKYSLLALLLAMLLVAFFLFGPYLLQPILSKGPLF